MTQETCNQQQRPVPPTYQQESGLNRVPKPILYAKNAVAWTRFLSADMGKGLYETIIEAVEIAHALTQVISGSSAPFVETVLFDADQRRRKYTRRRNAAAEEIIAIEEELRSRRSAGQTPQDH